MYDVNYDYDRPMRGEQPFFTDILSDLQTDDSDIGLMSIDWQTSSYPHLAVHKTDIIQVFNTHYAFREIGSETVMRWHMQLQDRFNQIAPKFDHAFELYDDDEIKLNNLGLGYVKSITYANRSNGSSSGSSNSTGNSKFKDTPTSGTSTINNPTSEQIDTGSGTASNNSNSNGSGESTEKYDYHDEHVMQEVNRLIDDYKSLVNDFVKEFNQNFIGIISILE